MGPCVPLEVCVFSQNICIQFPFSLVLPLMLRHQTIIRSLVGSWATSVFRFWHKCFARVGHNVSNSDWVLPMSLRCNSTTHNMIWLHKFDVWTLVWQHGHRDQAWVTSLTFSVFSWTSWNVSGCTKEPRVGHWNQLVLMIKMQRRSHVNFNRIRGWSLALLGSWYHNPAQ